MHPDVYMRWIPYQMDFDSLLDLTLMSDQIFCLGVSKLVRTPRPSSILTLNIPATLAAKLVALYPAVCKVDMCLLTGNREQESPSGARQLQAA